MHNKKFTALPIPHTWEGYALGAGCVWICETGAEASIIMVCDNCEVRPALLEA